MKRLLKTSLHRVFLSGQRLGLDILPRHFYSEIPDIRKLQRSVAWKSPYSMMGVSGADADHQLAFVRRVMLQADERSRLAYERACIENGAAGYGIAEAQFLFQYITHCKPQCVVQVGAGVSTSIIIQAAESIGQLLQIVCVDPFPTDLLRRLAKAGRIDLVDKPAEEVNPDLVRELRSGDLLFIDSTHTLGPSGEVTRLVLEWLPRLKPGVHAHFHDIMFPYDYMPTLLDGALFFPHETALLHGFLCMNPSFEILCSLSMLHHARRRELAEALPQYGAPETDDGLTVGPGNIPSSIFLKRNG